MKTAVEASLPIDFFAVAEMAEMYNESLVEASELSVHEENTGRIATQTLTLVPGVVGEYVPFVDLYKADDRKHDLARGLGGLGLITVDTAALRGMSNRSQRDYAAMLVDFGDSITRTRRLLAVPNNSGLDRFQRDYGTDIDDAWALQYSAELASFFGVLNETAIFRRANEIDGLQSGQEIARRRAGREAKERRQWHVRQMVEGQSTARFLVARQAAERLSQTA